METKLLELLKYSFIRQWQDSPFQMDQMSGQ
jgi:hypothetical protein